MLIEFFYALKKSKIPVSINEFLTLLEALKKNVIAPSIEEVERFLLRISEINDLIFSKIESNYRYRILYGNSSPETWSNSKTLVKDVKLNLTDCFYNLIFEYQDIRGLGVSRSKEFKIVFDIGEMDMWSLLPVPSLLLVPSEKTFEIVNILYMPLNKLVYWFGGGYDKP